MAHRVVVTGLGLVTPVGTDVESTWSALLAGTPGAAPITKFDPAEAVGPVRLRGEGLRPAAVHRPEGGPALRSLRAVRARGGPPGRHPGRARRASSRRPSAPASSSAAASAGCRRTRTTAPPTSLRVPTGSPRSSSRCSFPTSRPASSPSGTASRDPTTPPCPPAPRPRTPSANRYNMIRNGMADAMVTGGVGGGHHRPHRRRLPQHEGAVHPERLARDREPALRPGPRRLRAGRRRRHRGAREPRARRAARRADPGRGAGLRLERRRLPHHLARPSTARAPSARCAPAWRTARSIPTDVGYINAHGTSTEQGDIAETEAVKAVFGEQARKLVFGSTKSMTGHLLGGGGRARVRRLAAGRSTCGVIPPTINQFTPDPRVRSRLRAEQQGRADGRGGALQLLRLRRPQRDARGREVGGVGIE